jgi:hypothetical protein
MSNQPFDNDTPQAERKAIVKNDSHFSRQQNIIDDAGGRYAKLNPAKITGSTPSPVPQQPTSSPWAKSLDELTGPEGPLGFDIEFVGELGGASPVLPCAVESATPDREGPDTPLSGPSPFSRRRF